MAIRTGIGTTLKIDGSTVANVKSINGPNMSKDTIESTALDTLGGYKTFITGLKDPGTLTFTLMFDKTGYLALKTAFESNTASSIEITLPDGTKFTFSGFVTGLPLTISAEDIVTCDVTIQISGMVNVS